MPPTSPSPTRRTGPSDAWACLAIPTAIALVVRLAHFAALAAADPLFVHPVVDAWFHFEQAREILERGWLLAGEQAKSFYKGPLYSYLLALLIGVFGETGAAIAARLIGVACGTASTWLVARIGLRLGGPRAAWTGGMVAALYGTSIYFDATMLLTPLVTLGLLVAVDRMQRAIESTSHKHWLWAGLALGLVTITRANGLLVVAAVIAWLTVAWRERAPRAALLIAVGAGLAIVPVTARNVMVAGDPVVVSWNGGINLFMGNDPGFDQTSGNWHPDLAWMRLHRAPSTLGLNRGADHQRFFVSQSLARAADEPVDQVRLLALKSALLLTPQEIPNNRRMDQARARSPVLSVLMAGRGEWRLPFVLIGPLLAIGLCCVRPWPRGSGLLLIAAAAWAIAPVLFFHTARYRLPAIMLLLPLASVGWTRLWDAGIRAHRARLAVGSAVALAMFVVGAVTIPDDPVQPPSDELGLAEVAKRENRPDEMLAWREKALARWPDDPLTNMRVIEALRITGDYPRSIEHAARFAARDDLAADWRHAALRSRARSLMQSQKFAQAAEVYSELLASAPDAPRSAGRADFHLRNVPPLLACELRLEYAQALDYSGQRTEAIAQAVSVGRECDEAPRLAGRAQALLQNWAAAGSSSSAAPEPPPGQ